MRFYRFVLCVFAIFFFVSLNCDANKDFSVGGIKLLNNGFSIVLEESEQENESIDFANDFLTALVLPSNRMLVSLSVLQDYARSMYVPLEGTSLGADLLQADLTLKQRIRAMITNMSNEKIVSFWSSALANDELFNRSNNIQVWIKPAKVSIVELKDGMLIKNAVLEVEISNMVNKELWVDIVIPNIEDSINTEPVFKPLRDVFRILICSQWYKEYVFSSSYRSLLNSFIDSEKLAGFFSFEKISFRPFRFYSNIFFDKKYFSLGKRDFSIFGGVDFSGVLKGSDREVLSLSIDRALELMNMFKLSRGVGIELVEKKEYEDRIEDFFDKNLEKKDVNGLFGWIKAFFNRRQDVDCNKVFAVLLSLSANSMRDMSYVLKDKFAKLPSDKRYVDGKALLQSLSDLGLLGGKQIEDLKDSGFVYLGKTGIRSDADVYDAVINHLKEDNVLLFPNAISMGVLFGQQLSENEARFFEALFKYDAPQIKRYLSHDAASYFIEAMKNIKSQDISKIQSIIALVSIADMYMPQISYVDCGLSAFLRVNLLTFSHADYLNGLKVVYGHSD